MSQNTKKITLFSELYARNGFATGESARFYYMACLFDSGSYEQTQFLPIYKTFFLLKCASQYPSNPLLSISYYLHFSATKNLMTDLCSTREQSVWIVSKEIFYEIKISFAINYFDKIQCLHLGKKILETELILLL